MRFELKNKSELILKILAISLFFCQPLFAQRPLPLHLQTSEENREPISFMRPFYAIHTNAASTPSGPPSTAHTPTQIRHAYGFDQVSNQGAGQIIGIVDAYDDPNIASDLNVFDQKFGLAACTAANGCFRQIYASGRKPAANVNWSVEIALDVEWAHAIAPQATILLIEASTNSLSDLMSAVDVAVRNGASVVSMSWTAGEFSGETSLDTNFVSNGVTFLAASGDTGTGAAYPASSPDVIGVGGTALYISANGTYQSETAWGGSGGGLSAYEKEPLFQALFGIADDSRDHRGAPDVSYNASPATGFAEYDSYGFGAAYGWLQIGGTSAGTPQWAALIAIANSMRTAVRKAHLSSTNTSLYSIAKTHSAANLHAVMSGSNGSCGSLCGVLTGYDYMTGLGTPQASAMIASLVAQ
jgi:subtilase family serine protease